MTKIVQKKLFFSLFLVSLLFGISNVAKGLEIRIVTDLQTEVQHTVRLNSLVLNHLGMEFPLQVANNRLLISNGLIIGSGSNSYASTGIVIGGGTNNSISGDNSGIGGGFYNEVSKNLSVIGGGTNNETDAEYTAIAGGSQNRVLSGFGTIVGGTKNTVRGNNGITLGGSGNEASVNGLSMGKNAKADSGSFSWNATQGHENSAQIYSPLVLIGRRARINNVALIVNGAVKLGNRSLQPFGGEIAQSGGYIYAYTRDGYDGTRLGKASASNGIYCIFGKSLISNGDTVTGYLNEYSTGKCQPKLSLTCSGGELYYGGNTGNYYPYCYEIGTGIVFDPYNQASTCTITYNCNLGKGGPYTQRLICGHKGIVRHDGCEKTGSSFTGWSSSSNAPTPTYKPGAEITVNDSSTTLYAVYSLGQCGISFDSIGGSIVSPITITCGLTGSKPTDPTKACNYFDGWYTDSTLGSPYNWSNPVKKQITLYAKWQPESYTITYNCNGGNGGSYTQTLRHGSAGYLLNNHVCSSGDSIFVGWSTSTEGTELLAQGSEIPDSFVQGCDNHTLYAIYSDKYRVTLNPNGGTGLTESELNQYVVPGQTAVAPTNPNKRCYTFGGWYMDQTFVTRYFWNNPVNNNIILFAKWTPNKYRIKYSCNGGKPTNLADQVITYGSTGYLYLDGCTKTNAEFIGWSESKDSVTAEWTGGNEITGSLADDCENKILYAVYKTIAEEQCKGEVPANARLASGSQISSEAYYRVYENETEARDRDCAYVCKDGYTYVENYNIPQCVTCVAGTYGTGSSGDPTCQISIGCNAGWSAYAEDGASTRGYSCQLLGSCSWEDGTHPEYVPDLNGENVEYKDAQPIGTGYSWECTPGDITPYQCQYQCRETFVCGNDRRCSCVKGYFQEEGNMGQCYIGVPGGKYKTSSTGTGLATCPIGTYSTGHKSYYNSPDDNACVSCEGLPNHAEWTSYGTEENNCEWQCLAGYYKDGSSCEPCPSQYNSPAGSTGVQACYKEFTVTYNANGANSIGRLNDSCKAFCTTTNCATSCTVMAPSITRQGFTVDGWNRNPNSHGAAVLVNENITLSENATYYAITHKDIMATFMKGEGVGNIGTTSGNCQIWNTATSCNISIPTATCNIGYYNPIWNPADLNNIPDDTTTTATCTPCTNKPDDDISYYTSNGTSNNCAWECIDGRHHNEEDGCVEDD